MLNGARFVFEEIVTKVHQIRFDILFELYQLLLGETAILSLGHTSVPFQ